MRMNKARLQVAEDFRELEASDPVRNVAQLSLSNLPQTINIQKFNFSFSF
jgi:hypothetical protein